MPRNQNTLYVVETEDNAYLGRMVKVPGGAVKILTGRQGNPPIVLADDIVKVTAAHRHPGVVPHAPAPAPANAIAAHVITAQKIVAETIT